MSLNKPLCISLLAFLVAGCSTVGPLFKGGKGRKTAPSAQVAETPAVPVGQESCTPQADDLLSLPDVDPDGVRVVEQPCIEVRKNRPTILFGETESAHIRIPGRYNDPFPSSGELVVRLEEMKDEFCYPYDGKLISPFGRRGRSMHTGVDIKAVPNDTIRAAFPGVVRLSKYYSGYGNAIVVRHYNGIETVYAHQSKNLVRVNDVVEAGQPIGLAGRTGRATTEHLHFELRVAGEPVNPTMLIDTEKRDLCVDNTLYCYNRGGRIRVATRPLAVGESPVSTSTAYAAAAPASSVPATKPSVAAESPSAFQYHYVQKGETLSHIAKRYSTTVAKLCSLNGLNTKSILQIKQRLRVK
ncbi:M23 family metallopeptidase [uncultured Alistipes sp.]|uniref:M23 family metallopeptidase n=1 Tax=uncultured Alistipes sp. TaxID=538949 RepID=UPI002613D86A|nr:M23 family metallopeptidase [uncultured Alistipes sp.]